jgi:hypothetical protein
MSKCEKLAKNNTRPDDARSQVRCGHDINNWCKLIADWFKLAQLYKLVAEWLCANIWEQYVHVCDSNISASQIQKCRKIRQCCETFLASRKFPKFSSEFDWSGKMKKSGKFLLSPLLIFQIPYAYGYQQKYFRRITHAVFTWLYFAPGGQLREKLFSYTKSTTVTFPVEYMMQLFLRMHIIIYYTTKFGNRNFASKRKAEKHQISSLSYKRHLLNHILFVFNTFM